MIVNKSQSTSNALHIFFQRKLLKKGHIWTLGNSNNINFWHDIWMEESSLLDKVIIGKENDVDHIAEVGNSIDSNR